ncbi:MAG: DAK2 domain-containing protein [Eubacteriales bacterium]|nr:DAK2 domain-containing protein [Eubacteriales bacterium]
MSMQSIDAGLLKKCFIAGAKNLEANKEYINELNVFPVPDGDTGTNMTMTIMSAARAVAELSDPTMDNVCKAISSGSLRGARGNSGVILSQLLRGFCKVMKENPEADANVLSQAFLRASETAYKAVMKPKEGTILTVARGMAEKMQELVSETTDIEELLKLTIEYGDETLKKTPELLPVLKEAGVVDSGGQGLMTALKGALSVICGQDIDLALSDADGQMIGQGALGSVPGERRPISTDDIKFGYCTEFIVNLEKPLSDEEIASFKGFLESIGDSIVCVADDDMVKVHVHTNHPGQAFEKGLEFGSLSRMKVDNMREEHEEKLIKDASKIAAMEKLREGDEALLAKPKKQPHKENAFITVCAGKGLAEIFEGLGANYVIEGGQTMNPSTEDMLNAIELVDADNVFILPNNKNIILAAEQAAKINTDVSIHVIPTKTIPQGITALINYCDGVPAEENAEAMTESLSTVKSGQVTYAVRNTSVDGREIREGDIMGIGDTGILAVGQILNQTTLEMLRKMTDEDSELITVYFGEDVKEADAEVLCDDIRKAFPHLEVELQEGGQPIYYYIVSVE